MLLLVNSLAFSQNIYPKVTKDSLIVITPVQLRKTNLIFLEHNKFKQEIEKLCSQIVTYDSLIEQYKKIENNRQIQIDSLLSNYNKSQILIKSKNDIIDKQSRKLRTRKTITVFGVTVGIVGILFGAIWN